jgi:hypothetical protein
MSVAKLKDRISNNSIGRVRFQADDRVAEECLAMPDDDAHG